MPSTLRVFLADDHAVVREGLKSLLNSQPDMQVIGEASNGREAQQKLCECQADIAVLDLAMPEIGGAELTTWLQKNQPHVGVIASPSTRIADTCCNSCRPELVVMF